MYGGSGERERYFNVELWTQPVEVRSDRRMFNTYCTVTLDWIWIRHWSLSIAHLWVSSDAMKQRCRPPYGTESHNQKNTWYVLIWLYIFLPSTVDDIYITSASRPNHFIPRVLSPSIERNGMGLSAFTAVVHGRDPQPVVQLPSGLPMRSTPSHHTNLHLSCPIFSPLQLPCPTV
jgi:hypothetical protein